MTREQAKIYAKISREDLEKIDNGYAEHYYVLCAYANGEEIEVSRETNRWEAEKYPAFIEDFNYRVKPNMQPAEPWKPKNGDEYFCVCSSGEVGEVYFDDVNFTTDKKYIDFGNYFRTREEAEAARERVRAALKGGSVVKENLTTEPTEKLVESLDGHELSDAEKGVIRILRRCKVETMWNCPFAYSERINKLDVCEHGVLFRFESEDEASEFGDLADDVIAEAEERREKGEPSW